MPQASESNDRHKTIFWVLSTKGNLKTCYTDVLDLATVIVWAVVWPGYGAVNVQGVSWQRYKRFCVFLSVSGLCVALPYEVHDQW